MKRLLTPVSASVGAAQHLLWYLRYHSTHPSDQQGRSEQA